MKASDFKLGKIFKNINSSDLWRVERFRDGDKYFVRQHHKDVSKTLDEDLFKEIN